MDDCDCIGGQWATDDLLVRYQYVSDFFIALAYFSIPLELIYFVKKSAVFPYRWVLVQFGAFIVLCGTTHLINMWTFREHTRTVAFVMTIAKVLTAVVSCATALMLVHIIPDLLSVKTRELFLKNKAAELDREMGLIRTQEETGRHVRMLTHEIRSSLDRPTILNTTLVELGRTLQLDECALWMPANLAVGAREVSDVSKLRRTLQIDECALWMACDEDEDGGGSPSDLQLIHTLHQPKPPPVTVTLAHPTVKQVFSTSRAVVISPNSPVTAIPGGGGRAGGNRYVAGDVVAVRIPLLHANTFTGGGAGGAGGNDWQDSRERSYALLVLMLPADSARRWHVHELEMVEVVADQVAVALSHAAILEESMHARDLLMEQNVALDHARAQAEKAIRARNDFLAVMNHEMRTPMHAIIALSTLLQETELTPEQRSMVDTVLKSSNLLATLIHDVLDLSHLEDGSMLLDVRTFNLHGTFREVASLVKPVASVKKLGVTLRLQSDVPEFAAGDERRLLQTALNVVGNAVKFTRDGSITITVCLERPEFQRDKNFPKFVPVVALGDKHYYIRVQVKDTGVGLRQEDQRKLFSKFVQADATTTRNYGGTGLGLAICKRGGQEDQRKVCSKMVQADAMPPPLATGKASPSASGELREHDGRPYLGGERGAGQGAILLILIPLDLPYYSPTLSHLPPASFVSMMGGHIWVESEGPGKGTTVTFVSMMGGHIWVESEGPGKGTTVTFVVRLGLPEKADDRSKAGNAGQKQAAGGAGGATKAVDFTGLKVLVCDDNHVNRMVTKRMDTCLCCESPCVNRMVTKRMVTRLGCEVTVVGSGRECLAALAGPGHGFKVLLQDLMMPDMDGYEVAKRVIDRIKNPDERPRIAALTANTDQATKDRCLSIATQEPVPPTASTVSLLSSPCKHHPFPPKPPSPRTPPLSHEQVLLQDLMMPDMDGYEVAKRVIDRIKNPDERPRIAALTANTDQATKDRCLSIGMDGVITKPISLEKMRIVFTELMTLGKIVSDPKA
ncbi:unnamed protein product [Closterium sp. Naga37s-1]|nr:unnamed protein product [Closterium sp. Naga37s-1]